MFINLHLYKKIAKILNIKLINIPPYSPHLNPIEQHGHHVYHHPHKIYLNALSLVSRGPCNATGARWGGSLVPFGNTDQSSYSPHWSTSSIEIGLDGVGSGGRAFSGLKTLKAIGTVKCTRFAASAPVVLFPLEVEQRHAHHQRLPSESILK